MFNWLTALSANASTQQRAPFPLPAAAIPVHTGINFQKKRGQAGQERESHKTQSPALRPGSKTRSRLRPAKNGKAISNGSQTGAGWGDEGGKLWNGSFLTQS